MRDIKFRVYDKDGKNMHNQEDFILTFDKVGEDVYLNKDNEVIPLYSYEIMQYCNFKDCDNKDVYEGDILEFKWTEKSCWGDEGTYKGYIEFKEGGFEVIYIDRQETTKCENDGQHVNDMSDNLLNFVRWTQPINIKVIGNIYENPELMEGK